MGIYDYWVDDVNSEPGVTARQKYVEMLHINIKSSFSSVLCHPRNEICTSEKRWYFSRDCIVKYSRCTLLVFCHYTCFNDRTHKIGKRG